MRYDNSTLKVLEVGSRPGGGLISESCVVTKGIDLRELHLCLSLGLEPLPLIQINDSTCFGTLYYQDDFNLNHLGLTRDYLDKINAFYEFRSDPKARKHILQDWLIAFGVVDSDSFRSYRKFYHTLNRIELIMQNGRLHQT